MQRIWGWDMATFNDLMKKIQSYELPGDSLSTQKGELGSVDKLIKTPTSSASDKSTFERELDRFLRQSILDLSTMDDDQYEQLKELFIVKRAEWGAKCYKTSHGKVVTDWLNGASATSTSAIREALGAHIQREHLLIKQPADSKSLEDKLREILPAASPSAVARSSVVTPSPSVASVDSASASASAVTSAPPSVSRSPAPPVPARKKAAGGKEPTTGRTKPIPPIAVSSRAKVPLKGESLAISDAQLREAQALFRAHSEKQAVTLDDELSVIRALKAIVFHDSIRDTAPDELASLRKSVMEGKKELMSHLDESRRMGVELDISSILSRLVRVECDGRFNAIRSSLSVAGDRSDLDVQLNRFREIIHEGITSHSSVSGPTMFDSSKAVQQWKEINTMVGIKLQGSIVGDASYQATVIEKIGKLHDLYDALQDPNNQTKKLDIQLQAIALFTQLEAISSNLVVDGTNVRDLFCNIENTVVDKMSEVFNPMIDRIKEIHDSIPLDREDNISEADDLFRAVKDGYAKMLVVIPLPHKRMMDLGDKITAASGLMETIRKQQVSGASAGTGDDALPPAPAPAASPTTSSSSVPSIPAPQDLKQEIGKRFDLIKQTMFEPDGRINKSCPNEIVSLRANLTQLIGLSSKTVDFDVSEKANVITRWKNLHAWIGEQVENGNYARKMAYASDNLQHMRELLVRIKLDSSDIISEQLLAISYFEQIKMLDPTLVGKGKEASHLFSEIEKVVVKKAIEMCSKGRSNSSSSSPEERVKQLNGILESVSMVISPENSELKRLEKQVKKEVTSLEKKIARTTKTPPMPAAPAVPSGSAATSIMATKGGVLYDLLPFEDKLIPIADMTKSVPPVSMTSPPSLGRAELHTSSNASAKYKGVVIKDGQVIQSTIHFAQEHPREATSSASSPATPRAGVGVLYQDRTGKVMDKTTDELTPEEGALLALKQAKMLLDNYHPNLGAIIIRGHNVEQANRVYAALLFLKEGSKLCEKTKIESRVVGCKGPASSSRKQQQLFIKQKLLDHLPDCDSKVWDSLKSEMKKLDESKSMSSMKESLKFMKEAAGAKSPLEENDELDVSLMEPKKP